MQTMFFQTKEIFPHSNSSICGNQISAVIESLSISQAHQTLFAKNFELLKTKYQKILNPNLNIENIKNSHYFLENPSLYRENIKKKKINQIHLMPPTNKIYVLLALLTIYELEIQKHHINFNYEEWDFFSRNFICSNLQEVFHVTIEIFKNNHKNFKWTYEEDCLLKQLILQQNPNQTSKNKWKTIANLFNQGNTMSQIRNPSQCKERWENILKKSFKKGEWSHEEDLKILDFVISNGSKWAKLSQWLIDRTEHSVKNRFFSLISAHTLIPIKKIKKEVDYLNKGLLFQTLQYHHKFYDVNRDFDKTLCLCNNCLSQDSNSSFPMDIALKSKISIYNLKRKSLNIYITN